MNRPGAETREENAQRIEVVGRVLTLAENKSEANVHGPRRPVRAEVGDGPFPAAVECNGFTFTGAISGVDGSGKVVSPLCSEQTARAFENLERVLTANGQRMAHVLRCTIYLTDPRDAKDVDKALEAAFSESPPAISMVEVNGLRDGRKIAVEAVAARPQEGKDVYDFMG
ncbi:MAG TPA: RidA family protein [Nitrospinota bacterium]|nr:RidA family protein [Nitrospinota bacterium]